MPLRQLISIGFDNVMHCTLWLQGSAVSEPQPGFVQHNYVTVKAFYRKPMLRYEKVHELNPYRGRKSKE